MILVIGEAVADIVVADDGAPIVRPGGSPANVAVGLGRLGHSVTLVTALGDDRNGDRIRDHLAASEVAVVAQPIERTATATVMLDASGSANYAFDIAWELGDLRADDVRALGGLALPWVHVGSIALVLEPGAAVVRSIAAACAVGSSLVSYDPNCRSTVMGEPGVARAVIEQQVAASDVVKLSDQDADWLFPGKSLDAVAQRWLDLGPQVVLATRGDQGALAWIAGERLEVPASVGNGPVIDTVGAGDAFMAAVISHLVGVPALQRFSSSAVCAALELGAVVARMTCERVGADPPWVGELP